MQQDVSPNANATIGDTIRKRSEEFLSLKLWTAAKDGLLAGR